MSNSLGSESLTAHLLSLHPTSVTAATEHPFLHRAGNGTLPAQSLAQWLTQDRLYGLMGYTRLMGGLMSKLPSYDVGPDTPHAEQLWRRLRVISGATANITREMAFFEDVARRNKLPLDIPPSNGITTPATHSSLLAPTTQGYIDYMANVAANGTFEEALVLLWGMEVLYLKAWTYAKSVRDTGKSPQTGDAAARSALAELIPNWSSPEFAAFVDDIAALVDDVGKTATEEQIARYRDVWARCLWFEERFWDAGGEE